MSTSLNTTGAGFSAALTTTLRGSRALLALAALLLSTVAFGQAAEHGPVPAQSQVPHSQLPQRQVLEGQVPDGKVPEGLSGGDWSSIQAAYQAGRHAITASPGQPGTWTAYNPGQQWTTRFDGRGFDTQPQGADWQWGLQLQRWGLAGAEQAIDGTAAMQLNGQRSSYRWTTGLEEWYVNDTRGLEHGYIVHQRPAGDSDTLRFELKVRGELKPQIDAGGKDVRFVDAQGNAALTYSGLKVWEADGVMLAAAFEPLQLGSNYGLALAVDTSGARYPITVDPLAQQAYLKASNTDAGDDFGRSVAISGDTVVVGAPYEDSSAIGVNGNQSNNSASNAGAAYVFSVSVRPRHLAAQLQMC